MIDTATPTPTIQPAFPIEALLQEGADVLAVWAHPDDESYLGGGLMAAAAAAGGRVVNVTATLGEHGTDDPVALPPARLAGIRRQELQNALAAMGVHESVHLGFEDGTVETVDTAMGVRRISTVLDEVDPDVVVTFGPDGFTGHPDHIAIGNWTREAVAARPAPPVLLETAVGRSMPSDLMRTMDELGAFFPGFRPERPRPFDVQIALDPAGVETKLAALAAHSSQTVRFREHLGDDAYRRLAALESYSPGNDRALRLITGLQWALAA